MNGRRAAAGLLMLALACGAAAAPAHIEALLPQARLAGSGDFRYFGMQIYTAELLVGPQGWTPAAPFALDLRYARHLSGKKIAEASVEQMEGQGAGTPAQRQAWLRQMLAIFPDVDEGSHLTGINLPQEGVRFYRDGVAIGSIADPAFARAFFGIWLDPGTSAPALRRALLQKAAPQ